MTKTQIIHWDDSIRAYFSVLEELITSPLIQFVVNALEKFFLMGFVRFKGMFGTFSALYREKKHLNEDTITISTL